MGLSEEHFARKLWLMNHVHLQYTAVDCPPVPSARRATDDGDRLSMMMHCDICISSIDRSCQSGRIIDHKVTWCFQRSYWNGVLFMVLHLLVAQKCSLWKTNWQTVPPYSDLSVFQAILRTHTNLHACIENLSCCKIYITKVKLLLVFFSGRKC